MVVQFGIAILMPDIGRHTVAGNLINRHFSFGILILILMAVRLGQRLLHPVALGMPNSPAWERRSVVLAARGGQGFAESFECRRVAGLTDAQQFFRLLAQMIRMRCFGKGVHGKPPCI